MRESEGLRRRQRMLCAMTLHRPRRPYSKPYARRKLAAARAALAAWEAATPTDWRARADRHQGIHKWTLEAAKWQRVLDPPPVERFYTLPV